MTATTYQITTVTLNVTNLNKMTHFYQEILGLIVLKQTTEQVSLGIKTNKQPVLILNKVSTSGHKTSGLYHVAYLLPTRAALGNFLHHLALTQYPIEGASDHGYSEAVYLTDPEGNGIEVYADKPLNQWDIRANGVIVGITEAMDIEAVLSVATEEFDYLPSGSSIGHVHLAVSSVTQTTEFFEKILDFTVTTTFGKHAAFYGKNGYHHQFAGNIWQSRHLPNNDETEPGLQLIDVAVSSEIFTKTKETLIAKNYPYEETEHQLAFQDPNGILFHYQLTK